MRNPTKVTNQAINRAILLDDTKFKQLRQKYDELTYAINAAKVFPFLLESLYAHAETFLQETEDYNSKLALYDLAKVQKLFIDDMNKRYQEIDCLFFEITGE